MTIKLDDPRLTAYALGELDDGDRAAVEALLAGSAEARAALEAIRRTAERLEDELSAEPMMTQSANLRKVIESHRLAARLRRWLPRAAAAMVLLTVAGLWVHQYRLNAKELFQIDSEPRPSGRAAVPEPGSETTPKKATVGSQQLAANAERQSARADGRLRGVGDAAVVTCDPSFDGSLWQPLRASNSIPKQFNCPSTSPPNGGLGGGRFPGDKEWEEEPAQDGYVLNIDRPASKVGGRLKRSNDLDQRPDHPWWNLPREGHPPMPEGTGEAYSALADNPFQPVLQNPLSTFSIDVDTASYANVRRILTDGRLPPPNAVRIEEMLNYFTYDYAPPTGEHPFAVHMEATACPWNSEHRLVRIGLKGRVIPPDSRPTCNLVFLIDVSGSMDEPNKLPLVKQGLAMMTSQLGPEDRVAIVVYAGESGVALESTPTANKDVILDAIERLNPGGSTNGGAGIEEAYGIATSHYLRNGVNRVVLCTDGDFNVGVTDRGDLVRLIEDRAKSGVFLSVLGFGMGNLKDATLEQLADKGNGHYAYIDSFREAKKVLVDEIGGTLVTIAKDVKVQIEFNPAQAAAYRLIGYENRLLAARDFNDDTKDAGEIGAGHTVTALYEVVPAALNLAGVDPLRYQKPMATTRASDDERGDELMSVRLRYKQPDGDQSTLIEVPLKAADAEFADASADLRFAAAVAGFGMLLRNSPHRGDATFDAVIQTAVGALESDLDGQRSEFVDLVRKAKTLAGER